MITQMTSTVQVTAGDWQQLTDGHTFVLIQAVSTGVIRIHGQAAGEPDPEDESGFVSIARNINDMESSFSAGGLPVGTKLWVKAQKGNETINVLAY